MGDLEAGEEVTCKSPACCWQGSTSSWSCAHSMCLWMTARGRVYVHTCECVCVCALFC